MTCLCIISLRPCMQKNEILDMGRDNIIRSVKVLFVFHVHTVLDVLLTLFHSACVQKMRYDVTIRSIRSFCSLYLSYSPSTKKYILFLIPVYFRQYYLTERWRMFEPKYSLIKRIFSSLSFFWQRNIRDPTIHWKTKFLLFKLKRRRRPLVERKANVQQNGYHFKYC